MASAKIKLKVSVGGPLADGTAHGAVHEWIDASKKAIADDAESRLRAVHMDRSGRSTGYYAENYRTTVLSYNDILIDNPVVYGPWLEGTSSRNESTRFKGYHLWRKARQATAQRANAIAEEKLPAYMDRIGGRS